MGRGVQLFLVVAAALALGAAPKPSGNNAAPNESRRAKIAPAPSPPKQQTGESPLYKQPCGGTTRDRESDLCAQWEAADAASDSAFWTMIGVIVGAVGTGGLLAQIWLTRRALAVAMADRKPSLDVDNVVVHEADETIKVQLEIKNFGQGEARDVIISTAIAFGPYPLPDNPPPLKLRSDPEGRLAPGKSRYIYTERHDLTKWKPLVEAEEAAFLVYGHMAYADQFGNKYADRFYWYTTGKDFGLRAFSDCGPWKEKERPKEEDKEPRLDLVGGGPKAKA